MISEEDTQLMKALVLVAFLNGAHAAGGNFAAAA